MNPSVAGRKVEMPHNTAAEESVVGAILIHPSSLREISARLNAEDFTHPALRAIYEAMGELNALSKPIDVLTVVDQMRSLGTFDRLRSVNGARYLDDLQQRGIAVHNIVYHADLVRRESVGRRALAALERGRTALAGGDDAAGVAELVGHELSALAEANADGWTAPVEFSSFELPSFPLESLPPVLAAFASAEAAATQTPVDMTAMLTLSVCATALAKRVVVRINEGYHEPLNLYCVTVLPPGERKTAVMNDVTAPLIGWEQDEHERLAPTIRAAQQRYQLSEKRLEKAFDAAAKAKRDERERAELELDQLREQHEALKVPVEPRLMADDVTPEQLVTLMSQHDGRMALFSAEGGVLGMMAGRYSDAPNLDPYLKGHSGEPIRVDRRGRAEWIKSAALTVGLAVQPVVLEKLAEHHHLRGIGLLARFLWTLPTSRMGARQVDAPPVAAEVRTAYHKLVRDLLGPVGEQPIELRLDTAAHRAYLDFARWLEPQLSEFGELGALRDWAAKLTGAMVRISGILGIVAKKGDSKLPLSLYLTQEDIQRGVAIARYLVPHAVAAFAMVGSDPKLENAKAVLRCIERKGYSQFSRRELQQALKGQERFKDAEKTLDPALAALVDRHFIRALAAPHRAAGTAGRPAGATYLVNPLFLKGRNPQNPRNGVTT